MFGLPWYVIVYGTAIAVTLALILYWIGWLIWVAGVFLVSVIATVIDLVWGDWIWGQTKEEE